MTQYQSYIEVPRWANAGHVLVECAQEAGVHLEMRESKGLVRTTFYYTVTGEERGIARFKSTWGQALANYEARISS